MGSLLCVLDHTTTVFTAVQVGESIQMDVVVNNKNKIKQFHQSGGISAVWFGEFCFVERNETKEWGWVSPNVNSCGPLHVNFGRLRLLSTSFK